MSSVDVIVPCYNYGRYLRECVESVLSQTGVEVRVLILDDASTDDTPEVATALAADDPRVEVRRHPVNQGHIATYNEGLEWISEDYAALISADDLLTPGSLLRASTLMDAHPDVGFVYGKVIRWQAGQPRPTFHGSSLEYQSEIIPGIKWIERICEKGFPITSPEVVVRTKRQTEVGGYCSELPDWADQDMWLRFAAHGAVGYIDEYQAYYRIHDLNMHLQGDEQNRSYRGIRDFRQRREIYRRLFDLDAHLVDGIANTRFSVLRRLAEEAFWEAAHAFDHHDIEMCKKYLSFALDTYPDISLRPFFTRFRCKMLIGSKTWALLRPLWDRIQRLASGA
jgi:glycosyltransferase involved in cell wall biosynthesis